MVNTKKNEEVCHDARSYQEKCGAGIWCTPNPVDNYPSLGKNMVAEDHA
jgi:hypothetical protein